MDSPNDLLQLAHGVVIGSVVVVVLIAIWAIQGRIPRDVAQRYPSHVVARSARLFAEEWRALVSPNDMPIFLKARSRRIVLMFALVVLGSHVPLAYGFLESMSQAWQCHIDAISWPRH